MDSECLVLKLEEYFTVACLLLSLIGLTMVFEGMVDLKLGLKPKGSGGSGGFFGGQTPLGSDPRSQLFFAALVVASRHFFIKNRKLAFFSKGILSFVSWLAF